ncbi:type II secretion system protein GspK [Brevundimonas sp.]|uniref:type II secretion system protein GspK n=1 Tax=Brevundimonas sp. TaxID=1871086 RepID=UPI001A26838D|nr:type II secretion system protein GspK [Brevundimonas sp.]MBJ7485263.1 general secretion pathway protein GspK [Brevundimonas sp.]
MVTLIFLVAITALANLTREANSAQARVRFTEAALTLEANLSYLAVTEPLSIDSIAVGGRRATDEFEAGLPQGQAGSALLLHLDGRPYSAQPVSPLIISVQDEAGMINLAGLDELQSVRLAEAMGLGDARQRRIQQIYLDYVDTDSLARTGGAEQSDYGRARTANRSLLRPSEWLSLLGVRPEIDNRRWRGLESDLAFDRATFLMNVNTASSQSLQILFGITQEQAEAAVRARQSSPFLSLQDFVAASGASNLIEGERRYTFPSGRFVYTIRDTRSRWVYRARISLTPGGAELPLWIDQAELKEAAPDAASDPIDATPFPYPLG